MTIYCDKCGTRHDSSVCPSCSGLGKSRPMTAPDDVRACPFCGNAKMEIHHNTQAGITFLLCGDDRGRGGCGAVVSFRPNLTGSKAIQAYNRRAAHADLSGAQTRMQFEDEAG